MIKLFVEQYCETCPEFEPYVSKDDQVITTTNPMDFLGRPTEKHICNTRIYCKHRGRCDSIYTRAKEHAKEAKTNGSC